MIEIKSATVYRSSDNTTHETRAKAVEWERYLKRRAALVAATDGDTGTLDLKNLHPGTDPVELSEWIAENGDAIAKLLDVKEHRGRAASKPSVSAALRV